MAIIDLRILDPNESGAFPDLTLENFQMHDASRAIVMGGGTVSGGTAIQIIAQRPDGKWVAVQLTAKLLDMIHGASVGARIRWGEAI